MAFTGRTDLKDAKYSFEGKRFHLACFLSQQAAEKALKAFLYAKREENVFGHSVAELCTKVIMHNEKFRKIKKASVLDKYYIPTRYPDGLPYEMFDKEDAMKAISLASEVIKIVKKDLKMADE